MQVPLDLGADPGRPLQARIFDQIETLILQGKLRGGDPVPPSRVLSAQLGVSRNTIVIAYEKLLSEGYIESRPGVGTFVSSSLPEAAMRARMAPPANDDTAAAPAPAIAGPGRTQRVTTPNRGALAANFWIGRVAADSFPDRDWRRIVETKLRRAGGQVVEYPDPQGLPDLREAIADHLGPARGVAADAGDVLVAGGSQDGLMLLALALRGQFRHFIHEDPCYQGARFLFENLGFSVHPVPVDSGGLAVERLPDLPRSLVYVTPSHQYPSGVQLSLERRLRLLHWAERTGSLVIEDDYNGDFRYEGAPLTALRGLDRQGRVIYLGTFSKSFGPAIRLGYVVAPPGLVPILRDWKILTSNGLAWLEQAAMAEFMHSGGYRRHLRRIRAVYLARRNAVLAALDDTLGARAVVRGRRGGMHLSVELRGGRIDMAELERRALGRGVGVYRVETCGAFGVDPDPSFRRMLMLGYAAVPEPRIRPAIEALAEIVRGMEGGGC